MVYRKRIYYTAAQKAEMWDRWQRGETLHQTLGFQTRAERFNACVASIG